MMARAWALQLTMNVFVGVLNDDDDEQDEEDPSANHRVDRGESEQFWRSVSICHEGFWAENSADARIWSTQCGSGSACGEITGSSS